MYHIIKFIKQQWFGSVLIILWILSVVLYQNDRNQLIEESKVLENKIEDLEKKSDNYKKELERIRKVDTIIVDRIKKIKEKEYVQIKVIDSLTISGLQEFFTDRYSEKK